MKIGIIGYGVVGKAVVNTLELEYEIVKFDKYQFLHDFGQLTNCKFIFITVPTPFDCSKNRVDDSAIVESLERLSSLNYSGIVLIKSTVPPGFCSKYLKKYKLDIVFNPEFLRESTTPNEDFKNQDVVVIGTDNKDSYSSVKNMYKKVLSSKANYFQTSIEESEMIKCAQNTMLASRVALANMIFDACSEHEVDYENVKKIAFDSFEILGPNMVQVPGPDGKRGFGGKCLPKDIRAFSTIYDSEMLNSIIRYNDSLRNDLDKFLLNYGK